MIFYLDPGGAANLNFGIPGAPATLGTNLPAVDPNNFAGTVHFGPSVQYSGQVPPGAALAGQGYNVGGAGGFYPGI